MTTTRGSIPNSLVGKPKLTGKALKSQFKKVRKAKIKQKNEISSKK